MAHPNESPTELAALPPDSIEASLVTELVSICIAMRQAVPEGTSTTRNAILHDVIKALDIFVSNWQNRNLPVDDVLRAVRQRREGIHSLLNMRPEDAQITTRIYEQYLSLENVPSQITAAIEQSRLDRGLVPSRYTLLNRLIEMSRAQSYLEIGCCNNDCFNTIQCSQKVGVDPNSGGTLRMTSDAFFEVNAQTFDIIFIDGLHESWQVDKDIEHALRWSSPEAIIVLHDCYPLFEVRALVPRVAETWNGDVWKSLVRIRSRSDLDCATGLFDHGCAVIRKRPNSSPIEPVAEGSLSWGNLTTHRQTWLRPMSYDDLLQWVQRPVM